MNIHKAKELAETLLAQHGLTQRGWVFLFDRSKRRFGCCKYGRLHITLSLPLTELNDESHVKNTILHEIAHALVGSEHGHDEVWRAKAIEIGCTGDRCYDGDVVSQPKAPYTAVCPNCKTMYVGYRKHKYSKSCGKCSPGVYNVAFKLNFVKA